MNKIIFGIIITGFLMASNSYAMASSQDLVGLKQALSSDALAEDAAILPKAIKENENQISTITREANFSLEIEQTEILPINVVQAAQSTNG